MYFTINQHAQEQQKQTRSRPVDRIYGEKKVFFASPYSLSYVKDGQHKGANQTQHRSTQRCKPNTTFWSKKNIFACSKMLIPVIILSSSTRNIGSLLIKHRHIYCLCLFLEHSHGAHSSLLHLGAAVHHAGENAVHQRRQQWSRHVLLCVCVCVC